MSRFRGTPQIIHKSLHRPKFILGGDRNFVLFCGLFAFLVGLGGFNLISAAVAILFWLASLIFIRRMCKKDPLIVEIFKRYAFQQKYYPAQKSPFRKVQKKRKRIIDKKLRRFR